MAATTPPFLSKSITADAELVFSACVAIAATELNRANIALANQEVSANPRFDSMRQAARDLPLIFRRFLIIGKTCRLPDDVRRPPQFFTAFIGSKASAVSATTSFIFRPAFHCGDRARSLDGPVPDSRQIDRVELQKRRSVQLRRGGGPEELPYRRLPDA